MRPHQDSNNSVGCEQVRDELGAWSLGALDASDAAAIDRHLASCEGCQREAASWRDVAGAIPLSLQPANPSLSAKHALMARIAEDQLATTAPTPAPRLASSKTAADPASPQRSRRFHWSQLLVAPLAIALVVMTMWSFELRSELDGAERDRPQLLSSIAPNGLQSFQLQSDCEQCDTAGRMLADPEKAEALMVAWNLDPGEVHEVWCEEGDGARTLVANLQANDTGEVVQPLSFEQPIAGYKRIFVMSQDGEIVEIRMSDLIGEPATPAVVPTGVQ